MIVAGGVTWIWIDAKRTLSAVFDSPGIVAATTATKYVSAGTFAPIASLTCAVPARWPVRWVRTMSLASITWSVESTIS